MEEVYETLRHSLYSRNKVAVGSPYAVSNSASPIGVWYIVLDIMEG